MTRGSADGNGLVTARRIVAGRYRLEERIGSGAMGVVWRGTDERLGRVVAVKQVFLHSGLDQREADEVRQRTLREGRIAARLQHAHAISVFDASIEGDEPWLVMEYLPSRSLAAVLGEHGTIDPRQAARMGRQVADALDAAHQAGIVHRDVKPGNVLIGADGVVKITDFGISRATGDLTLTRTGVLAGTPAYLAPEVARGEDSTPASDVFSLGATLYAAVEGIPPFGADDNALALLHSVAAGQVTPPNRAGPLTALLMRLLRDDPDERPSAAEARAQLGRVAVGARDDHGLAGLVATTSDPESGAADLPAARASSSMSPGPAGSAPNRSPDPRNVSPGTPSAGSATSARPQAAGPPTRPGLPPAQPPNPRRGGVGWGPSARPASRAARRVPRPTMAVVIVVLLLAVAAGGVVGVALLSSRTDTGGTSAASPAPTPGTTSVPDADPGGAMVGAVRDYYAVVTGDSAAGWARLGPELQSQAGGLSTYQGFWSTITRVQVLDASADGRDSVLARLEFEPSGRPPTRETHRLGLLHGSDGHWLINSDERLAG